MSQDEWEKKWLPMCVGLALCGLVSELRDGPMERGSKALEIPARVKRMLAQMYADATGQPAPAQPTKEATKNGTNGASGMGHQGFSR